MLNEFSRTELLLGSDGMKRLSEASVAVFGVGGVGSYCVEALARSGIGHLCLVDSDTVALTNLNRQLIATHSTLGKYKVDAARERILDINPACNVEVHKCFYSEETDGGLDLSRFDYIVDAIDTVKSKALLIERAQALGVPIISCMGAGNKLDPTKFQVADISKTEMCPLAKVMRRELRLKGIKRLKVVFSTEPPVPTLGEIDETSPTKPVIPGSIAFVPSTAGLILAGEVIKDLIKNHKNPPFANEQEGIV